MRGAPVPGMPRKSMQCSGLDPDRRVYPMAGNPVNGRAARFAICMHSLIWKCR